MKVSIVLRSPFLDKIPSLKNLIIYLSSKGIKVKVFTCSDLDYPGTVFEDKSIELYSVPVRTKKLQTPTLIRLGMALAKDLISDRSDIYIGADAPACKLLIKAKKYFSFKYWNFLLEYPDIDNAEEVENLIAADHIITHDKWHSDFLIKNCHADAKQFLYLPNSTFTNERHESSLYLQNLLSLSSKDVLLLHSGGLGKWFLCQELADASISLGNNQYVVFHTSHNATGTDYFKKLEQSVTDGSYPVKFSLTPVSDSELDELVASATIGLAFYSVPVLGYRAEYMGVAAGKIGNYLKCGVPVIATKLPSLQYIEDYKCGILIDDFSQLAKAVNKILDSKEEFKENAYRCYRDLWEPTPYLETICKEIEQTK